MALYVHLLDQLAAGMLTTQQAEDWALHLLDNLAVHFHCETLQPDLRHSPERWLEEFLAEALTAHLQEQTRLYSDY